MQPLDHALGQAYQIVHEKRLGEEILRAQRRPQPVFDVAAAGHKDKRYVTSGLAPAQLVVELAAVQARHAVIADDQCRGIVHGLEQRVAAIFGRDDFANRLQAAHDQVADQRIIVHDQNAQFGSDSSGSALPVAFRRYTPLLPPIFSTR